MACATIAAADGRARAKPPRASRQARSRARFWHRFIKNVAVRGALVQIGNRKIERKNWDWDEVARNPFFCPDAKAVDPWTEYLEDIRKKGSSVGAVIEVVADGIPAGLGAPIYGKLDADLASAMMSINAVKGVEIGDGFAPRKCRARRTPTKCAPEMTASRDSSPTTQAAFWAASRPASPIVARFAVKPTSSILSPRKTIDIDGNETEIVTKGRHDPCVGIRAVPVGEAMMALVLADHALRHIGQTGRPS